MKIFATRVWGYHPPTWPLITFSGEGILNRLLKQSMAEDIVVFVGTLDHPTQERDRGRLLGFAQFGRYAIDSLDVLQTENLSPEHYENGKFKWPTALVMTRAWEFTDDPYPELKKVLSKQLPYQAISQAVLLDEYDSGVIRSLPAREVDIPITDALARVKRQNIALSNQGPTKGIMPSNWISLTGRTLGKESFVYAMRYGKSDCWKIGYTTDLKRRLSELNQHIPSEIGCDHWQPIFTQKWPEEKLAFEMEQNLLASLSPYRSVGERVICSYSNIETEWIKHVIG